MLPLLSARRHGSRYSDPTSPSRSITNIPRQLLRMPRPSVRLNRYLIVASAFATRSGPQDDDIPRDEPRQVVTSAATRLASR